MKIVTEGRYKNRMEHQFWVSEAGEAPFIATGYSTGDVLAKGSYWFVPSCGSSMAVGYDLFITKEEAMVKATEECRTNIKTWQEKLAKLI